MNYHSYLTFQRIENPSKCIGVKAIRDVGVTAGSCTYVEY